MNHAVVSLTIAFLAGSTYGVGPKRVQPIPAKPTIGLPPDRAETNRGVGTPVNTFYGQAEGEHFGSAVGLRP